MNTKQQRGFSLIELLIAIAFLSVMVTTILTASSFSRRVRIVNQERLQALLYAQEAVEVARQLPIDQLSSGTYHPVLANNIWSLTNGSETINIRYLRVLDISDVYRVSSTNGQVYGRIVTSGGYLDPNSRHLQATVSWDSQLGGNLQEQLDVYLERWEADRWLQSDWSGGGGQENFEDDDEFDDSGGGIDFGQPGVLSLLIGNIDWSDVTTTGFYNTPGNFDNNDVAASGDISYLVTENNPSDAELYILDTSNIEQPALISKLDVGASLTGVYFRDDYLYVASDDNSGEFKVLDVSDNQSPEVKVSINLTGNDDGTAVAVNESTAYVLQTDKLYSIDITNPLNPQILDNDTLSANGSEVFVAGSYLYIATQDASKELQIYDITNPANLQLSNTYDLGGSVKANDIYVLGNYAYVSTDNSGNSPEFYILDVTDPTAPSLAGSHEIGETVFSLVVIGDFALAGTNFLDTELIVLNVSDPAVITEVGSYDLFGHILNMVTNCSTIYAATSGNQGEFFILSTNVPDCNIATSGWLESSTFDTGSDTVEYNWVSWSESGTANTTVKLQIATSSNIDGPWNFLGPDGSSQTYYTNAAQELINYDAHKDQRYLRYRIYLSTEAAYDVPIVEQVIISYST